MCTDISNFKFLTMITGQTTKTVIVPNPLHPGGHSSILMEQQGILENFLPDAMTRNNLLGTRKPSPEKDDRSEKPKSRPRPERSNISIL